MADDLRSELIDTDEVCAASNSDDTEEELEADIVEFLREFGVRYIRNFSTYCHCDCSVPPIIRAHFMKCQQTFRRPSLPISCQMPPLKDDFNRDVYGDFGLQDFFVRRDERDSVFGVIHFSQKFVNIEFDAVLREYSILHLSGKPSDSFTHRGSKDAFKEKLKRFIMNHSVTEPSCPAVNTASHIFVMAFPSNPKELETNLTSESDQIKKGLVNDIIERRLQGKPVEFPYLLQFRHNWLVPTIDEQSAAHFDCEEMSTKLTSFKDIRELDESEIFTEDLRGNKIVPAVVFRKKCMSSRSFIFKKKGFNNHSLSVPLF